MRATLSAAPLQCAGVAALAVLASACVPLPYATPPVHVALTSGVVHGRAVEHGEIESSDVGAAVVTTARIGIHPTQLAPDMRKRLDVGVGYLADMHSDPVPDPRVAFVEGAYLESSFWPAVVSWSPTTALRLGVIGDLDLLFADTALGGHDVGLGAMAGLDLELSHYCTSPIAATSEPNGPGNGERTDLIGVAAGEVSVGATAQVGYRWIGPQSYWMAVFGLTFRLPATAGLLLVWLL